MLTDKTCKGDMIGRCYTAILIHIAEYEMHKYGVDLEGIGEYRGAEN